MAESTIELWDGIYRRIYAAALRGKRINSVSLEAEAAFWRLHLVADDYGGFDADPLSLRVTAFRKRPEVTEPQIQKWLKELGESKLIQVYPVCEDTFGTIIDFIHFQPAGKNGRRVRKYPPPVHSGESKGIQGNPYRRNNKNNNKNINNNRGRVGGVKKSRNQCWRSWPRS